MVYGFLISINIRRFRVKLVMTTSIRLQTCGDESYRHIITHYTRKTGLGAIKFLAKLNLFSRAYDDNEK